MLISRTVTGYALQIFLQFFQVRIQLYSFEVSLHFFHCLLIVLSRLLLLVRPLWLEKCWLRLLCLFFIFYCDGLMSLQRCLNFSRKWHVSFYGQVHEDSLSHASGPPEWNLEYITCLLCVFANRYFSLILQLIFWLYFLNSLQYIPRGNWRQFDDFHWLNGDFWELLGALTDCFCLNCHFF